LAAALSLAGFPLQAAEGGHEHPGKPAAKVDTAYVVRNAAETAEWPSYGLNYGENRFSTLKSIDTDNVSNLGLAWSYDLQSKRGIEATPLVVDGVMYVTASWSVVHAIDARTGKKLWTFDPQVPRKTGSYACCDVVSRGVALYQGRVYLGTLDGRLIALDAGSGKKLWVRDTRTSDKMAITITGAPRVYDGKVLIGCGGGEFDLRGYIAAYDAKSGKPLWRWFTVPGNPAKPFENKAMEMAAKTWDPAGKYWQAGGGGPVWNTIAYDPELRLVYFGVGNGLPWSYQSRSPSGGDNLFLSSIVALHLDTGEYAWHYQETPGESWDYDADADIILADLMIEGKPRKALIHAPKNGFFFVLDRSNGQFISAKNYVPVNWASGYDDKGRPTMLPSSGQKSDRPFEAIPGAFGGHNWQSMSFNPELGLAYIPAQHVPVTMQHNSQWKMGERNIGDPMSGLGWNLGMLLGPIPPESQPFGRLIAWDPVQQKEVWRHEYVAPWNGGTLTTAGKLVFQGTADGRLVALDARDGRALWDTALGTGAVAAPMTYELDGRQYVSIAAGWGGVFGESNRVSEHTVPGTVYTFVLGGQAKKPDFVEIQRNTLLAGVKYKPELAKEGGALYVSHCLFCHGVPGVDKGGNIPNLGYSAPAIIENLDKFVFKGPMMPLGMPDFSGKLSAEEVEKIKAFIQGTADSIRASS
jgi:quinohemoprotein ethanol dehydrogenase